MNRPTKEEMFEERVKSMQVSKKYTETGMINSVAYSMDGDCFVTASDDDNLSIYANDDGQMKRLLYSKRYGCQNVRFTHHQTQIIYSSSKGDNAVRYHSLHTNQYLRHFTGHSAPVTSLSMSPVDDMFLSCSEDKSLRLWDLRQPTCSGIMNVDGQPIGTFDPEGLIFAAGIDSEYIRLYDLRTFSRGPFSSFKLTPERALDWVALDFALEGNTILISTNGNHMKVIDAFDGSTLAMLGGHKNTRKLPLRGLFTPDGRMVMCGSEDGFVHVWRADGKNGDQICKLNGRHPNAISAMAFNPFYDTLVTACKHLCIWLPDQKYDQD